MLRQKSQRLNRQRSTYSVQSTHKPIDPQAARHQAQTAAMVAFTRGQERGSAESCHNFGSISSNNSINHLTCAGMPTSQDSGTQEPIPRLRRQQSVRFVGPNGLEHGDSFSRGRHMTVERSTSYATLKPMAITTDTPVPAMYTPPSRTSSLGKTSINNVPLIKVVRNMEATMIPVTIIPENETKEEDVASTPSSYQRLRRTKSMFSPLKAPSVFYTNGNSEKRESYAGQYAKSQSQAAATESWRQALRAPKSMIFLHNHREKSPEKRNDTAVQEARDRFFQEAEQQRLRSRPSFLFRSKAYKQERQMRSSVRASSVHSQKPPQEASTTNTSPDSKDSKSSKRSSLKSAAHKAGKKIKNKFRKVFQRGSKEEPAAIPDQQVDAPETHVRKYNGDSPESADIFDNFSEVYSIPHPEQRALENNASRAASTHTIASETKAKSYAGSMKSLKSDHSDDKSMTSNRTPSGRVYHSQNSRTPIMRDNQRLSVINEVGTHRSSSTKSKSRLTNQHSAYPRLSIPGSNGPERKSSVSELSIAVPERKGSVPALNVTVPEPKVSVAPSLSSEEGKEPEPLITPASADHAKLAEVLMNRLNATKPELFLGRSEKECDALHEALRGSFEECISALESAYKKKYSPRKSSSPKMLGHAADSIRLKKDSQRNSSITSNRAHNTPTIRQVPPSVTSHGQSSNSSSYKWNASDSAPSTGGHKMIGSQLPLILPQDVMGRVQAQASDDVFSPQPVNKENIPPVEPVTPPRFQPRNRQTSDQMLEEAYAANTQAYIDLIGFAPGGESPQAKANRLEPYVAKPYRMSKNKKRLLEAQSAFFGGTGNTMIRKTSPYREAIAEMNEKSNAAEAEAQAAIPRDQRNPLYRGCLREVSGSTCTETVYSDSVYSRTTGGGTNLAANSNISLTLEAKELGLPYYPTNPGSVTSTDKDVYRPRGIAKYRMPSNSPMSDEWKAWTASELLRLEKEKRARLFPPKEKKPSPPAKKLVDQSVYIAEGHPAFRSTVAAEEMTVYPTKKSAPAAEDATHTENTIIPTDEKTTPAEKKVAIVIQEATPKEKKTSPIEKRFNYADKKDTTAYIKFAMPSMPGRKAFRRHVRETAQMHTEETEVFHVQLKSTPAPAVEPQTAFARKVEQLVTAPKPSQAHMSTPERDLSKIFHEAVERLTSPHKKNQPLKPILKKPSTVTFQEDIPQTPVEATIPPPPPMAPPLPPPIPPKSPLRPKGLPLPLKVAKTPERAQVDSAPTSTVRTPSTHGRNVLQKRVVSQNSIRSVKSNTSLRSIDTPNKLVKRQRIPSGATTPASIAASEKKYGSLPSRHTTPNHNAGQENIRFANEGQNENDTYRVGMAGSRMSASEMEAQAMGSQKMVQLFLNSRRKRIVSEDDDTTSGNAFL